MNTLQRMFDEADARRAADKERFKNMDQDECQLCGAHGPDKRTLRMRCFYAIHEAVPEAIDMRDADGTADYLLRICKGCRARFLGHLGDWRAECIGLRGTPMDHDGDPLNDDYDHMIPVRENGAIRWLTRAEWEAAGEETQ